MKLIPVDRTRRGEFRGVGFDERSPDFAIQNVLFAMSPCILAGVMALGKAQNETNYDRGLLVALSTYSNLIVFRWKFRRSIEKCLLYAAIKNLAGTDVGKTRYRGFAETGAKW